MDDEAVRTRQLRWMKARATGLLVAAAVVFVVVRATTDGRGWAGYVEAAAEAGMVGGLADWFAVTALFRHPLGLPIPHTAIIPKRKDQIGESLGDFVQENFLDDELLAARMHRFGPAEHIGRWLTDPANAQRLAGQTSTVISGITGVLRDDDVAAGLEAVVTRRLERVDLAPVLARGIEIAIEGRHHQAALDAGLRGLDNLLVDNTDLLRRRLRDESPWWVPEVIDDRVFAKISNGIRSLAADILADPDHELRGHVDARTRDLAERLTTSPELVARVEQIKIELLDHPEVRSWMASLWDHLKQALITAADDPGSDLRQRLESALTGAGRSLVDDPDLRAKVDAWLETVVRYLARHSQGEVADLIATTVAGWDTVETSRRLELQVGRDLQFIRINGTVVGALAGVAIHFLAGL